MKDVGVGVKEVGVGVKGWGRGCGDRYVGLLRE